MKNLPSSLIILALLLFFGTLSAQTPESILKSSPKIPSVETLKGSVLFTCGDDEYPQKMRNEISTFEQKLDDNMRLIVERIEAIKEESSDAIDKANKKDDEQAEQYIGSLTGGKTIEDLENMSEAELMALGMRMATQQAQNPQQTYKRLAELTPEQQTLGGHVANELYRLETELEALIDKHKAMLAPDGKYEKIDMLRAKARGDALMGHSEIAEMKRACAELKPLENAYYNAIIPEWLKLLENQRAAYKKLVPDQERLIAVNREIAMLTATASGAIINASVEVEAALSTKLLPWEAALKELDLLRKSTAFVTN